MASRFRRDTASSDKERRSSDQNKPKQSTGTSGGGQNVKSARSFWEAQVRSSKVVQVRRGSAEQSFAPGLAAVESVDGNDSDQDASVASQPDGRQRATTSTGRHTNTADVVPSGSVEDAEAAISRLVRELRNELVGSRSPRLWLPLTSFMYMCLWLPKHDSCCLLLKCSCVLMAWWIFGEDF